LGFSPYFDIRHNEDGAAVSCTWLYCAPKKIPWYSLHAELTTGLLNAGRRNRSFENFQGTYWKSTQSCGALPPTTLPFASFHICFHHLFSSVLSAPNTNVGYMYLSAPNTNVGYMYLSAPNTNVGYMYLW
jgi:hypothetical protein